MVTHEIAVALLTRPRQHVPTANASFDDQQRCEKRRPLARQRAHVRAPRNSMSPRPVGDVIVA
jgi:hypothetical protein